MLVLCLRWSFIVCIVLTTDLFDSVHSSPDPDPNPKATPQPTPEPIFKNFMHSVVKIFPTAGNRMGYSRIPDEASEPFARVSRKPDINWTKYFKTSWEAKTKICSLNTQGIIEFYGYKSERHTVITHDGYILTVFQCYMDIEPHDGPAVIIFHDILCSSDDFVIPPPEYGLPYALAREKYNVFLANTRGNYYSKHHKQGEAYRKTADYWNFSWDTIGYRDIPAIIDFVCDYTNSDKVYIIGHSQASSSLMALLSNVGNYTLYKYNERIHAMAFMSPVGYMGASIPMNIAFGKLRADKLFPENVPLFKRKKWLSDKPSTVCGRLPKLCTTLYHILFSSGKEQTNPIMVGAHVCHYPSGTSSNAVKHYALLLKHKHFGGMEPDEHGNYVNYQLNMITVPILLLHSDNDNFVKRKDVDKVYNHLKTGNPNIKLLRIPRRFHLNHLDYVIGVSISELINNPIIRYFDENPEEVFPSEDSNLS